VGDRERKEKARQNVDQSAKHFYELLKRRSDYLFENLAEDQVLALEYHSPLGKRIFIYGVSYNPSTDMFTFTGEDRNLNLCEIVGSAHDIDLVLRVFIPRAERLVPARGRIRFTVEPEPVEGVEPDPLR
jgi:hypothetical protein